MDATLRTGRPRLRARLEPPRPLPPHAQTTPAERAADEATRSADRAWRCKKCGHVITSTAIEVDGQHTHLRLNPSAFAFIFGCFRDAPGCLVVGEPTAEASWFTGHQWQFAMCGGCGAHLGWAFSGASTFFGLILERLVEPATR